MRSAKKIKAYILIIRIIVYKQFFKKRYVVYTFTEGHAQVLPLAKQ
jgi:hypothetical protein